MKRLSGKNIVITGGTSGIGKASAIKLAKNGANLIISGRSEAKGEQVINEISTYGVKSKFIKCDVTNKDDVKNLFDLAISEFGLLDQLCRGHIFQPRICDDNNLTHQGSKYDHFAFSPSN